MRASAMNLAIMLALVAAGPGLVYGQHKKYHWPTSRDQLQASLQVIHALEGGPLVCTVVLRNVSSGPLDYGAARTSPGPFSAVEAAWPRKKVAPGQLVLMLGGAGSYAHRLAPGETEPRVYYLHKGFLAIPPGKCNVRFGWNIYGDIKGSWPELLFVVGGKQEVEVLRATATNLARVLRNLEQELARIRRWAERENDFWESSEDQSIHLVNTLTDSRHEQFVGLLTKAIDCLPGGRAKHELIRTVYDSYPSPRAGFAALAEYLAWPAPASAGDLFEYWKDHDKDHRDSAKRQQVLKNKPKPRVQRADEADEPDEQFLWEYALSKEEAWRTSRRHLDTRLTGEDFARLRAMPNVWVRTLLYSYYPEHCPAAWREALLTDLKKSLQEPPAVRKLVTLLENSQYAVRERATQELSRLGPLWVPLFRELAKKNASPEAARRLRMIAETLNDPVPFRLYQRTVRHLVSEQSSQNKAMLQILLDASTPNKVTQAARAAVAERDRRKK